jgi:hypothetical protein
MGENILVAVRRRRQNIKLAPEGRHLPEIPEMNPDNPDIPETKVTGHIFPSWIKHSYPLTGSYNRMLS